MSLRLVAALRAWLPARGPARAGEARIDKLIVAGARATASISQRIDFISARAARHALSRLYADRRPAPAGEIRGARRRLRLRHLLRNGAGRGDRPRARRIRYRAARDPLSQRHRRTGTSAIIISSNGASTTSRTRSAAAIAMDGAIEIDKTVYWHKALGKRRFADAVIPRAMLHGQQSDCCAPATSSASSPSGRIWTISTSASSPSRPMASCCCAMREKPRTACSTSAWTASSRSTACVT